MPFTQTETNRSRSPQILANRSKSRRYKSQDSTCQASCPKGPAQEDSQSSRRAQRQTGRHRCDPRRRTTYLPTRPRRPKGRQSSLHCYQTEAKREGCQICCTITQGPRDCRGRDVQGFEDGEEQVKSLETDGYKGDLCGRRIHTKACQDGTLHPTDGPAVQKGQCYTSYVCISILPCIHYSHITTTPADLKATFQLPIIGVKKNPQSPMYTQLGVMTKGTVIEVNVSELGLVTTGGKAVWVCILSYEYRDTMLMSILGDCRVNLRRSRTTLYVNLPFLSFRAPVLISPYLKGKRRLHQRCVT